MEYMVVTAIQKPVPNRFTSISLNICLKNIDEVVGPSKSNQDGVAGLPVFQHHFAMGNPAQDRSKGRGFPGEVVLSIQVGNQTHGQGDWKTPFRTASGS